MKTASLKSVNKIDVNPKHQTGTALLAVLLVFAVVAYLSTAMLNRQFLDIRRTGHVIAKDQAAVYARAAEDLAMQVLYQDQKDDLQKKQHVVDDLQDDWARQVMFPLEGGGIQAKLIDLQRYFNINDLKDNQFDARKRFVTLLTELQLPTDGDPMELMESVVQWLDADENPQGLGVEDFYYLALDPSYRAGNQPLQSLRELLLVKGMTAVDFDRLSPYLTALPAKTPANLNTVNARVLATYNGVGDLNRILSDRRMRGYDTAEQAWPGAAKPDLSAFGVASQYFLLDTVATIDGQVAHLQSVIYRPERPNAVDKMRVIYRDQGRHWQTVVQNPP